MMLKRIPIALALILFCSTADGQQAANPADRFKLYNLCAPIGMVVETLPGDALGRGLTEAQLEKLIASRLQAVDLYAADAPTFLHVAVSRYAVQLGYMKPVIDVASSETETIRTFSHSAEVRDGTAAGGILELSKLLDRFLVEYRRVNQPACDEGQPPSAQRAANPPPVASRGSGGLRLGAGQSRDGIRWGRMWDPPATKETTHRLGAGVTSPRLLYKVEPEYSEKARKAKLQGTVMLGVEVWQDGRAHNIRVLRSLGKGLDEKAIEAVQQWLFAPGTKDGEPVRVAAQVQVSFRLIEEPERLRR